MTLCEDPITGEIQAVYSKHCPPGFVERVAGKASMQGIHFVNEDVANLKDKIAKKSKSK